MGNGAASLAGDGAGVAHASVEGHSDAYRPLAGYATLVAAFHGLAASGLVAAHRADHLRAPFTRFQSDSGFSEVEEAARGKGLQRAVGELLVCPECLGQRVAAAFVGGFVASPRTARTVAAVFTVYAAAVALQMTHAAGKAAAKRAVAQ